MAKRTTRVMIDVDGVLADFILDFTVAANRMGFSAVTPRTTDEQREWNIAELGKQELAAVWYMIAHQPGWWEGLSKCCKYAEIQRVRELQQWCEVYFCTARHVGTPHVQGQTAQWLEKLGIPRPSVITSTRKAEVASALHITHMVDDHPKYFEGLPGYTQAYLLTRQYNAQASWPKRVATLGEFLDVVEKRKP